jgi:hypothetical protein
MLSLGLVAFQGKPEPGVEDNLQGGRLFLHTSSKQSGDGKPIRR